MTTGGNLPLHQFRFAPDDIILMGRESAGVPEAVHEAAAARLTIPMAAGTRSLNVAMACAMASHEALRQLGGFPAGDGSG
jgi:tRNA (cytidine/uridine-2'-O-)-methyltransferase